MATDHAFDEAVKGCTGVIHTATPVMKELDPNIAIPMVVKGTTVSATSLTPTSNYFSKQLQEAMKAAAGAGIKRFVLTSSSTAASDPIPNVVFNIDTTTWNESSIKAAWAPPPYEGARRKKDVYSASKTEGERAAWNFVKSDGQGMVLNCVLPNANIGEILSIEHQGWPSTAGWVRSIWSGFTGEGDEFVKDVEPQYYINVDDDAKVHVAALIFKDVEGERLFSFAHPFNWNTFLALFRKMYPDREFIDDLEGLGEDKSIVANERAEELLKRLNGGKGWASLEESVRPLTKILAGQ